MAYKIVFYSEKSIRKDFLRIPGPHQKLIKKKLWELGGVDDITAHAQVKKLHHYPVANFRLRVGRYRILFDCNEENKEIVVFRILHRSSLY